MVLFHRTFRRPCHARLQNRRRIADRIRSRRPCRGAKLPCEADPALPDLPTVAEAGVPGYESGVWFGIMVPAGTPRDIIARLNAETIKGALDADRQGIGRKSRLT